MNTEPKSPLAVRVSMFANVLAARPADRELPALIEEIRGSHYAGRVASLRELRERDEVKYGEEKKKLPAFCVSGTARNRKTPLEHSGLLQVDMDKLNGSLESVRAKVKNDPHIAFGFVSPSGDGLKLGLRIDGARHLESFEAAQNYFRTEYDVEIDPAVKDRLRLCFVSHDPQAWTNDQSKPLPLAWRSAPQTGRSAQEQHQESEQDSSASPEIIVLPSGGVTISESARVIFKRIAPTHTLFLRGGALVELIEIEGMQSLDVLKPDKFRSDTEKVGKVWAWRSDNKGCAVLKPAKMSLDDAKAILAASESREFLPPVASVLRCPVMIENESGDVVILGRGYHREKGGLLIVAGETPPQVPLAEAVASLRRVVEEFDFQSEGDRSRALAAFLTPALRSSGFVSGNIPIDCAEADQSQAGKGHRHEMVCSLYNEKSYTVTAKAGGVGSMDESFAAALVSGRPFICLDNFRGRMNSQQLESFLTSPNLFPARIPHRGEVLVDPRRFNLQLSSNGLEATRDLANRASICRIRKRPGFQYRDTLGELKRRQSYFLGCVFAVISEWIAKGKPCSKDPRHDFREWNQTVDWIVQNVLGCVPLMDGHQAAQERTSNPALTWLRAVALAVVADHLHGAMSASELFNLCMEREIEIPGKPADEQRAKMDIGKVFKQLFGEADTYEMEGFTVTRSKREYRKVSGDWDTMNAYTFSKTTAHN